MESPVSKKVAVKARSNSKLMTFQVLSGLMDESPMNRESAALAIKFLCIRYNLYLITLWVNGVSQV